MYAVTDINREFTLMDKDAYLRLGGLEVWTLAEAVNLLASFRSQCDGVLKSKSWSAKHRKALGECLKRVCDRYQEGRLHLFRDASCEEPYETIEDFIGFFPEKKTFHVSSPYRVFVRKADLLACLEGEVHLDLQRLSRYLVGEDYFESDQEKAGSAKWSKYRAPMEACVKEYVVRLLDAGCMCDHAQVFRHAWSKFQKDKAVVKLLLKSVRTELKREKRRDYHMYLSEENVKLLVREVFELKAPDRIFKVSLHKRFHGCKADHK